MTICNLCGAALTLESAAFHYERCVPVYERRHGIGPYWRQCRGVYDAQRPLLSLQTEGQHDQ